MSLLHRFDTLEKVASDLDLQPSSQYTVTAFRPGGVIVANPTAGPAFGFFSSTVLTLNTGHGIILNDRIIIGIDAGTYNVAAAVSGNQVTILGDSAAVVGDTIINLGIDTGPGSPNFDGSDVVIYSTPDTTTTIDEARVTSNDEGEYDYYHDGSQNLWELVRDTTGAPVAFVIGAYEQPIEAATFEVTNLTVVNDASVGGDLTVTGAIAVSTITTSGNSTLGDSSTDVTTNIGRFVPRTITLDPTSNATAGTIGEVVYASTPNKFYGKHTTTATDTNWRLLGT